MLFNNYILNIKLYHHRLHKKKLFVMINGSKLLFKNNLYYHVISINHLLFVSS